MSDALLNVENLKVEYITGDSTTVAAVDNVSFSIKPGESLGLAGESGCGKSTIAYSLMRLHKPPALITNGKIVMNGKDVLNMNKKELQQFRWQETSMVFQSAMNCLNPVVTMEKQFFEIYKYHGVTKNKKAAIKLSEKLLSIVGIPAERLKDYPHQFSGGMRQRAVIAMALALNPKLLILDEPTTALDTVVQRDIIQRIFKLQKEYGFAILFITHDISLMMEFCDSVAVMYAGRIIEQGKSLMMLKEPKHPYTYGLKNSFPSLQGPLSHMEGIKGNPLNLKNIPQGCRFQDRCFRTCDTCRQIEPPRIEHEDGFFYCHEQLAYDKGGKLHE
ncbi:MAG: sugar ABC transporter ATP-binding protein [Candidatus Epulonipiscium fishelsonii]|nr:MAG: sugar ABC transporter ATP-binding protein [Epulopiscium sp. AS2M-Bin002]